MGEAELGAFVPDVAGAIVPDVAGAIVLDEAEIRALAEALGLALPAFTRPQHPGLFDAWADRVVLAESLRTLGRLIPAALDECDRQLGLAPSRTAPPQLGWDHVVNVGAGSHSGEVLRAIEDGIAAKLGERAP